MTWISMLRGINLGSHYKISMPDLVSLYESLGLISVKTYLQSGNVIFDSVGDDIAGLPSQIESRLQATFGYIVQVFLRDQADFQRLLDNNPFTHGRNEDSTKLHVTFFYRLPSAADWNNLGSPNSGKDEFYIGEQEVFLFCPNGYGRTKLSTGFFERKLCQPTTTRNWNTVTALCELVKRNDRSKNE